MKISDLLAQADVMFDVRATNKRLLLQELAARAAASLSLDVEHIAPYLLKRENLGSTGIGRGVAIPHARLPDLPRPCLSERSRCCCAGSARRPRSRSDCCSCRSIRSRF